MTGPWTKAAKWTTEEWFPAVMATGIKKFGWVLSPNAFAELSAKQAQPDDDKVRQFGSTETAIAWIKA